MKDSKLQGGNATTNPTNYPFFLSWLKRGKNGVKKGKTWFENELMTKGALSGTGGTKKGWKGGEMMTKGVGMWQLLWLSPTQILLTRAFAWFGIYIYRLIINQRQDDLTCSSKLSKRVSSYFQILSGGLNSQPMIELSKQIRWQPHAQSLPHFMSGSDHFSCRTVSVLNPTAIMVVFGKFLSKSRQNRFAHL